MNLHRIAELAQELVCSRIMPGDLVMDGTMGNGHDTLFLWKRVGLTGKVVAFDLQLTALHSTETLLKDNGWTESDQSVKLVLGSHGNFKSYINMPLNAVMFNLGYLPGSDKNVVTSWPTLVNVLDQLVDGCLQPGGIISLVTYSGHEGGATEQKELLRYVRSLPTKSWAVMEIVRSNASEHAPKLILVQKSNRI